MYIRLCERTPKCSVRFGNIFRTARQNYKQPSTLRWLNAANELSIVFRWVISQSEKILYKNKVNGNASRSSQQQQNAADMPNWIQLTHQSDGQLAGPAFCALLRLLVGVLGVHLTTSTSIHSSSASYHDHDRQHSTFTIQNKISTITTKAYKNPMLRLIGEYLTHNRYRVMSFVPFAVILHRWYKQCGSVRVSQVEAGKNRTAEQQLSSLRGKIK